MLFERYKDNPIIEPDLTKEYEKDGTYNPTAIVHENKVYLIYRAENKLNQHDRPQEAVSQLCLAMSDDGYNFEKYEKNPIIRPTLPEERLSCEDPRITKIGDTFYLTYTAYDGMFPEKSQNIYTALATSKDMINWKKQGIIVKGIKAAGIFSEKINDKYIMFIGGEYDIRVGESSDLINWKLDEKPIIKFREDKFDNRYVEVGPPPFSYKDKLVLFINTGDKHGIFHPSLVLLDKKNPRRILYRADEPLMTPTEDYEVKGNINNVIFSCGIIKFKGYYYYFYGTADKYICVATVKKVVLEKYLSSL